MWQKKAAGMGWRHKIDKLVSQASVCLWLPEKHEAADIFCTTTILIAASASCNCVESLNTNFCKVILSHFQGTSNA